jgi:hypothetical protein
MCARGGPKGKIVREAIAIYPSAKFLKADISFGRDDDAQFFLPPVEHLFKDLLGFVLLHPQSLRIVEPYIYSYQLARSNVRRKQKSPAGLSLF